MSPGPRKAKTFELPPGKLRWRCPPSSFDFRTTADIAECPIDIIGQPRAIEALDLGLRVRAEGYNIFISGHVGCGRSTIVRRMLAQVERGESPPSDLVFVHNFEDPDRPRRLEFGAGGGCRFRDALQQTMEGLRDDVPQLFESEPYSKQRNSLREQIAASQKGRLKEFETRVEKDGFTLVQVQMGPAVAPRLLPVVTGNPTEMDQLEELVEQGQFKKQEFERLKKRLTELRTELESVAKDLRNMERELHRRLAEVDRELARPLLVEALAELRAAFDVPGLEPYLDGMVADLLDHLDEFRESPDRVAGQTNGEARDTDELLKRAKYRVNVVVDNSRTQGRPIIWETAPSYRNLFGTIEAVRTASGDWATDHTRIKSGSLLRANGGFVVLDAMDLLAEPGVWIALKRSLRNSNVEIQVFDPLHIIVGVALKPEPAPIDVKVLVIGTPHIYSLLHGLDEDFKKIFKVKAEFATHTPLRDEELRNFACFVHKKIHDDELLPFHRSAVAAVVEHAVRLAGDRNKLTTRFTEIADVIRESGFWARRVEARSVKAEHVDAALEKRAYRVNLIEELLRDQIAEGSILMELEGERVGQVNGLAVLDAGDHVFAQPARITATTAMGEGGIIDIDREAEMSGAVHTKGVLILTGFLRSRFAQKRPLTLTASVAFEQSYGPIDGDSASSTELYALLSSLANVPLRQGIAVTGSVNQLGEVQPIGGVNEKIEGFFDLCRIEGLTGDQGVMIPTRNLGQLMLRKDLVEAVKDGRFHVWAVSTIEDGLEVLSGALAGEPDSQGSYPPDSIFGRVDAELQRMAEEGRRFSSESRRQ
jgi:lon-related putative ATP-dependent protease